MLFWQRKTPVISVCPIQITLQLETARLNDCSRNQAKQAAYRNNATRVFSENLERQTGGRSRDQALRSRSEFSTRVFNAKR